jgi:hypothetical protein
MVAVTNIVSTMSAICLIPRSQRSNMGVMISRTRRKRRVPGTECPEQGSAQLPHRQLTTPGPWPYEWRAILGMRLCAV